MSEFKGLDLIGTVPEELWTEVHNIAQEAVNKIILKKKKCKQAKWLSEEALQIAEEEEKRKARENGKDIPIPNWMQSSTKLQGEIRRPS